MTDPWEPHTDDLAAYRTAVRPIIEGPRPVTADEVLAAGLSAAFASLRARVGEPVTAELITAGADGWEYAQVLDIDDVNAHGADGWQVRAVIHDVDTDSGLVYVMERPRPLCGSTEQGFDGRPLVCDLPAGHDGDDHSMRQEDADPVTWRPL